MEVEEILRWWPAALGLLGLFLARWRQFLDQLSTFKQLWTDITEAFLRHVDGILARPFMPQPPFSWHFRIWSTFERVFGVHTLYVVAIYYEGTTVRSVVIAWAANRSEAVAVNQLFAAVGEPRVALGRVSTFDASEPLVVNDEGRCVMQIGVVRLLPWLRQRAAHQ